MKIREQTVDGPKRMTGPNEEIGRSAPGGDPRARRSRPCCGLERPYGRGADRDHAAASSSCFLDSRDRLARAGAPLCMHWVIIEAISHDRPERIEPHVERHRRATDAACIERSNQLVGEVQASGRRRGRATRTGKDGLVPIDITGLLGAASDVARQRYAAHAGEHFLSGRIFKRLCQPRSTAGPARERELCRITPVAIDEHDPFADGRAASRLGQQPPGPCRVTMPLDFKKKPLPRPTGRGPSADEPRRHHPRVIHDDEIIRREQVGQVADLAVRERTIHAPDDQESRGGPVSQRLLGDQFPREFVVVEVRVGHARDRTIKSGYSKRMPTSSSIHTPVLSAEVMDLLDIQPGMRVVDGTLGGGGHTRLFAEVVGPEGLVIAIDRDPVAIARGAEELAGRSVRFAQANFRDLPEVLDALSIDRVDRVLLDVGLSSDQLADHSRGFSFESDGPLDLRFDPTEGEPAWRLVNRLRPETLADVIKEFGEERFARRIARRIATVREKEPIRSARDFARVVTAAIPRQYPPPRIHPATRTFQALRIAVNEELKSLRIALERIPTRLTTGGRLAVIAFHSLEDRLAKEAFRNRQVWEPLTKGPIEATEDEISRNPRSRSAKLRVARTIQAT